MKQLLELRFENKKEEQRRRTELTTKQIRKPPYPIKLSKIWKQASRELKQVKVEFGDASMKQACAMGAISFYLSDNKTCLLSELKYGWQKAMYRDMVNTFESKTKSSIWELNDVEGWTFEDFSEKALQLGL
jgi:hypothetical protein